MQVQQILKVKGNLLVTLHAEDSIQKAIDLMARENIGSVVIVDKGKVSGLLTFREILLSLQSDGSSTKTDSVAAFMNASPLTVPPSMSVDELRRTMLDQHARYVPILENDELLGVISFHDVARAVVEAQDFENQQLKAYINDSTLPLN